MAKKKASGGIVAEAAVIKPKVVKPLTEKEQGKLDFINSIKKKLSEITLPKELQLSPHEKITNTAKFFDAHLSRTSLSGANVDAPYLDRLKVAFKMVGIEIENFDSIMYDSK